MKRYILILFLLGVMFAPLTQGETNECLIYTQWNNGENTIYLYQPDDKETTKVACGKQATVFIRNKHFFFFVDHMLYLYNVSTRKSESIGKFTESEMEMQTVSETNGLSQMLIAAKDTMGVNLYILDLADNSIRRVDQPSLAGTSRAMAGVNSPNHQYLATIKQNSLKECAQLIIQQKKDRKYREVWKLPKEMTVLPDTIRWSDNSTGLAFHAKAAPGYEGFYSLYFFNSTTLKLSLVKEEVLYYDWTTCNSIEEFLPDWSPDGKYLVFENQPSGSPSQSSLELMETDNGKSRTLIKSAGQNQQPCFSPSGKYVAFVSSRDRGRKHPYLFELETGKEQCLSNDGITIWMEWYR